MKKLIALFLCFVMCIGMCSVGFVPTNAVADTVITLRLHNKNAYVNGTKTTIDSEGTFPFTLNNSTMVPIRFISEKIGAKVDYVDADSPITVSFDNTVLKFSLDSKKLTITVGGSSKTATMDVAATIINGKTYIPLRAISENIGWAVEYISADRIIVISTKTLNQTALDKQIALGQNLTFRNVKMTKLAIDPSSTINLYVGDKTTVKGVPTPSDATLKNVLVYKSSVPSVATISSTGSVKAIASGETVISVTDNSGKLVAKVTVQVSKTYYWTPNGKSYHSISDCVSLSRSKTILSGSLEDAFAAGKYDPCNNCIR